MAINHNNPSDKFETLRQRAENLIKKYPVIKSELFNDILEVIHELNVHQVELEIQNEELKRAQQEISDLHREYESLYEFAPCGYLTLNLKGIITRANLMAVKLLNTTRQYLLKSGFTQFILTGWGDTFLSARQKSMETGEKQSVELPLKCERDLLPLWVKADIEFNHEYDDMETQWRMVIVDITNEKRAEQEKEKLMEQLSHTQKMECIGNLAGGIAHDFNNSLGVILGNVSIAIAQTNHNDELLGIMHDIEKGAKQAQKITQQLLTFAKGGVPLKKDVDIKEILKESVLLFTKDSNVQCEFSFPDDLWKVSIDIGQINQAIYNLIINAMEAMPDGGCIQIKVKNKSIPKDTLLLTPGNYVKITVKDNGIGIPKKYISKIFDPYFTIKQDGRGLGLAITYSIIKGHRGNISVESTVGKGTTFVIYLPSTETKHIIEPIIEQKELVKHKGQCKILIMDDHAMILKMAGKLFGQLGCETSLATDGRQAIDIYKEAYHSEHPFDLVILDLTVPDGMGGAETIKELLKIDPKVKAIVSSGYSYDPIMANYRDYGFCYVLPKPYSKADAAEAFSKILMESENP